MGTVTNSKRTVTVQLVPQPAAVDFKGKKEPSANLENEPNRKVACAVTSECRRDTEHSKKSITSTADKNPDIGNEGEGCPSHTDIPGTGNCKQCKPVIGKDPQTSRGLASERVNNVSKSSGDNGAISSTLRSAEEMDICKTSQSSPVTASVVDLPKDSIREKVRDREEAIVESKAQNVRKDTSKGSTKCNNKTDTALESSDSSAPQHRASEVMADTQENTSSSAKTAAVNVQPPLKLKGCDNLAGLSRTSAIGPDLSNNPPQSSKVETTVGLSHNRKEGQCENTDESSNRLKDRMSGSTSYLAEEMGKSLSPVIVEEVKSPETSKPLSPQNHTSSMPLSNQATLDVQSSKLPFNCVAHKARHSADTLAEEKKPNLQEHAKEYKEAATMTTSVEGCLPSIKNCQDAEVQAVADVHSRSAGTSPLMLPAGALHKSYGMAKSGTETLTVVYQANTGSSPVYQMTLDNNLSRGSSISCDTSIQTLVSSQIHSGLPQCTPQTVIDHLPEKVRLEAGLCVSQSTSVIQCLGPSLQQNMGLGAKPKEPVPPLCNVQKALPPLQPVYQINIESCNQSHILCNNVQEDAASLTMGSQCASRLKSHSNELKVESSDGDLSTKPAMSSQMTHVTLDTKTWPAGAANTPTVKSVSSHSEYPQQTDLPCEEGAVSRPNYTLQSQPLMEGNQTRARKPEGDNQTVSQQDNSVGRKTVASLGQTEPSKSGQEPGGAKTEPAEKERAKKPNKPKTVHDVVWDEQGMTWEVYGASVDPESLGFAIQSHLQSKIKEHERQAVVRAILRKSVSSEASPRRKAKRGRRNVFRSMLQNVRRPHCCSRPPPSAVVE